MLSPRPRALSPTDAVFDQATRVQRRVHEQLHAFPRHAAERITNTDQRGQLSLIALAGPALAVSAPITTPSSGGNGPGSGGGYGGGKDKGGGVNPSLP